MLSGDAIVAGAAALADAKAWLRVEGAGEDALIERLVASAAGLCEQFTGRTLIERGFAETIPASVAWTRLSAAPVAAITVVEAIGEDGAAVPIGAGGYAIDIDAAGEGWVRVGDAGGARRVRVGYRAGLATDWGGVPDALRQGMIRLAAHLYASRDDARGLAPPLAVTALWRPFRRQRIGGGCHV